MRQNDLTRLVRLAEEVGRSGADASRPSSSAASATAATTRRGVHLLTYHGAKGLEFELVLLPRLEESELPLEAGEDRRADRGGAAAPLRRHHAREARARVTWVKKPSRFLEELAPVPARREPPEGFEALKAWRLARARQDDVPAYLVFHNSTLEEIAGRRPRSLAELAAVPGVGPAKLERYGEEVLAALAEA